MVGDRIRCSTFRKVVSEGDTAVTTQRVRLTITVEVTAIQFEPSDQCIRLNGKNVEQNKHVKLGGYHTVELEPNRKFTIFKDCWDTIVIERLEEACDPAKQATLAAVVMQQGLANVCLITKHMTIVKAKIEQSIPRKRGDASSHSKALKKFYQKIMDSVLRHVDFNQVKCILLASPGYVKDDFYEFMMNKAQQDQLKDIIKNKSMFLLVHSSSGYKHDLDEVLKSPNLQSKLADTAALKEVEALELFFKMLHVDPDRAYYSYNHVKYALEQGAVETLMITDSLFRSNEISTRKKYVKLVEDCREAGAEVLIFSALHVSGQQLEQMSGVAALLRFPLNADDIELNDPVASGN